MLLPCPKCDNKHINRKRNFFNGGLIGYLGFNLVKCSRCGYTYAGRTGKGLSGFFWIIDVMAFILISALVIIFL